jgi:UDP-N-acetylmuramate dehydrogenase
MNALKEQFGDRLKENEPLAKHLNYRIGGAAKWFIEVKTKEELKTVVDFAWTNKIPWFILGGGSNTLASDTGFDGVVVKMALRGLVIDGNHVRAEAGVISALLARKTAEAGLAKMTWAISLPGTVGGAIRGNAGCFGGEMADYLTEVEVMHDGEFVTLKKEELTFGYRESTFKHNDDIIIAGHFEFPSGDPEALKAELEKTLNARKETQPLYAGSAGCIFKNYEATDEEIARVATLYDVPEKMKEIHRLGCGWLVDQLGLKGTKIGDAQISPEHGNFIVNLGKATASDIVQLIALVKTRARNELGIELHEEAELIGF